MQGENKFCGKYLAFALAPFHVAHDYAKETSTVHNLERDPDH